MSEKTKKNRVAVKVDHLSKSFKIPLESSNGVKQKLINLLKGVKGYRTFTPLNDVSFTVEEGDFFGIVGRNGSGKSTLLKTIAGIYSPEKGSVKVNGSLVPFIELGVGFNPELTGRENVYLNGALLGFSKAEMAAMYDDIVAFAELEEFMDEKLKNYSSGMQVRLAFSIAIKAEGDVLLLDEVLAVGDEAFQRKCFSYFAHLKKEKKTVILVTHNMDDVQKFCNKAMMIDKGEVFKYGNPTVVARAYRDLFIEEEQKATSKDSTSINENSNVTIDATNIVDYESKKVVFNVSITPKHDLDDPVVTFEIVRDNGELVYRWVTDENINEDIELKKNKIFRINLELDNIFPNGQFELQVGVKKKDRSFDYILVPNATKFIIVNQSNYAGDDRWKPNTSYNLPYGNNGQYGAITSIKNKLENKDDSFCILIGTPQHSNIGDRAIAQAEKEFIKQYRPDLDIIEIPFNFNIELIPNIPTDIPIYLQGGGNFGDLWIEEEEYRRNIIDKYINNKLVLFPQTIFFEKDEELKKSIDIYSKHPNLTLVARESVSYNRIKDLFPKNNHLLTPDIVMFLNPTLTRKKVRDKILFLIRDDKEKTINTDDIIKIKNIIVDKTNTKKADIINSDMHVDWNRVEEDHSAIFQDKINEFYSSKLVVTDRLHGMIFALITGTPCIVMGSLTQKTQGIYDKWISKYEKNNCIYFINNMSEFDDALGKISLSKKINYDNYVYNKYWNKLSKYL